MTPVIEVRNLSFAYKVSGRPVPVLHNLNFQIQKGELVAIVGPSGSGKSTLFYLLGCVLKPKDGHILIHGKDISNLTDLELSVIRNKTIGFVFQQFHLLNQLTARDNILLPDHYPLECQQSNTSDERLSELAQQLGVQDLLDRYPNQLSGGQQQRLAISRALIHDIDIVLADEPTGNLDSKNADQTIAIFKNLHQQGKTVILITHDTNVAATCERQITLKDGRCIEDTGTKTIQRSEAKKLESKRTPTNTASLFKSILPECLFSIKKNKVRSFLTMIGVTVGVAAIVSMLTFARFTKTKVIESYEAMGANRISLRGHKSWTIRATKSYRVMFDSFDWQKDVIPFLKAFPTIRKISPVIGTFQREEVSFGGKTISENGLRVEGVNAEYLAIADRKVIAGRAFSEMDVDNRNSVCLVGTEIKDKLFKTLNPLNNVINIVTRDISFPCRVIGILEPKTSNRDWHKPNLDIIMPHSVLLSYVNSYARGIHQLAMQADIDADIEKLADNIKKYFVMKYEGSGEFYVGSDSVLIAQMKKFLNLFTILLGSIAIITLMVGGIGIHNMMLVSLNERIKEIGLRRALGATQSSIGYQLLLESCLICGIAGTVGLVIGIAAYQAMIFGLSKFSDKVPFEWTMDPLSLFFGLVAVVAVGIFSGLGPARRAASLDVIEALRKD